VSEKTMVYTGRAWVEMDKPEDCCKAWGSAQQEGTDNEGYGALLSWLGPEMEDTDGRVIGGWSVGCLLPPIRVCPWCGVSRDERGQIEQIEEPT